MELRTRPVGREAMLVEVADAATALDLALWARGRVAAVEIVPAAGTVLFDGVEEPELLARRLADWSPGAADQGGDLVQVEVDYDGPDLEAVARAWGIGVDEVVRRHQGVEHVVAFCGFAPGFPYLTHGLDLPDVPRHDSPRSRVEPGSVGLAGPFTGIYPTASPGGWQLIGSTDALLWDPARAEPALLPPGTRVRFVPR